MTYSQTCQAKVSNAGFATFRFDSWAMAKAKGDTINTTIKGEAQDIDSALVCLFPKAIRNLG